MPCSRGGARHWGVLVACDEAYGYTQLVNSPGSGDPPLVIVGLSSKYGNCDFQVRFPEKHMLYSNTRVVRVTSDEGNPVV